MYHRDCYYDPQTGQFTQPDPVSYGDPYGFCATETRSDSTRELSTKEKDHLDCIARTRLRSGAREIVLERLHAGLVRAGVPATPTSSSGGSVPFIYQTGEAPIVLLTGTILDFTEISIAETIAHELRHTMQRSWPSVQAHLAKGTYELFRFQSVPG